jgi:hypothetical protein
MKLKPIYNHFLFSTLFIGFMPTRQIVPGMNLQRHIRKRHILHSEMNFLLRNGREEECQFLRSHSLLEYDTKNVCRIAGIYPLELKCVMAAMLCFCSFSTFGCGQFPRRFRLALLVLGLTVLFNLESLLLPPLVLFVLMQFSSSIEIMFQIFLGIFIYYHPSYSPLAFPALLTSIFKNSRPRIVSYRLYFAVFVCSFLIYLMHPLFQDFLIRYSLHFDLHSTFYQPSYGVFWYFKALMLPECRSYFQFLIPTLPWVCVIFLTLIFLEKNKLQDLVRNFFNGFSFPKFMFLFFFFW